MRLKSDSGPINVLVLNNDYPPALPNALPTISSSSSFTTSHTPSTSVDSSATHPILSADLAGIEILTQQNCLADVTTHGLATTSVETNERRNGGIQSTPTLTIEDLLQNAVGSGTSKTDFPNNAHLMDSDLLKNSASVMDASYSRTLSQAESGSVAPEKGCGEGLEAMDAIGNDVTVDSASLSATLRSLVGGGAVGERGEEGDTGLSESDATILATLRSLIEKGVEDERGGANDSCDAATLATLRTIMGRGLEGGEGEGDRGGPTEQEGGSQREEEPMEVQGESFKLATATIVLLIFKKWACNSHIMLSNISNCKHVNQNAKAAVTINFGWKWYIVNFLSCGQI